LESELWEKDELLSVVKYEKEIRNRAVLTLLWDFNARNHEVTSLKIKHIRLKERYGEGEVPAESKTGSGPILLTSSFPYVRDLLNVHPYRNQPEARLIYNLLNGAPITADHLCTIFKQLKNHITELIESGKISDTKEMERLQLLIRSKKWNPYCLRHSSLTSDSDYLPEYALKKKARLSMNSRQGARYIKARMGNDVKNKILSQNGIITEQQARPTPSVRNCSKCEHVNAFHCLYCEKCSYPLTSEAYDRIKEEEDKKLLAMEDRVKKMERTLESISESNPTFEMRREDGSTEEETLMPMRRFVFPEKISDQELEAQVREILLGKREPTGPLEYKIISKKLKLNADTGSTSLLLSDP
jgi:integrase/recombinase XerD